MKRLKELNKNKLVAELVAKEGYAEYLNRIHPRFPVTPPSDIAKSSYEVCMSATLKLFSYDALKNMRKDHSWAIKRSVDGWKNAGLDTVRALVSSYVYPEDPADVSYYLNVLSSSTEAMKKVHEKYIDGNLPASQEVMENSVGIILFLMSSMQETLPSITPSYRGNKPPHLFLSSAQLETMLAVLFIQRQANDEKLFWPLLRQRGLYSNSRWLTTRILSNPHNPHGHREDFLKRNQKLADIKSLFPYVDIEEFSFLCDYSTETLNNIVSLFESDSVQFRNLMSHLGYGEDKVPEGHVREFFAFGKDLMKNRKAFYVFHLIGALRTYHGLPKMDDYTQASEDIIRKCKALVEIARLLDQMHSDAVWGKETETLDGSILFGIKSSGAVRDYRLAKMLIQEPERAEEVIRFIKENKTADYSAIQKEISCQKSQ